MCKETWNELRIWTKPKLIKKRMHRGTVVRRKFVVFVCSKYDMTWTDGLQLLPSCADASSYIICVFPECALFCSLIRCLPKCWRGFFFEIWYQSALESLRRHYGKMSAAAYERLGLSGIHGKNLKQITDVY